MYPFPFTAQAPALGVAVGSTASLSIALPGVGNTIRVVNEGPNIAFVSIGIGAQVATVPSGSTPLATSTPCPVGDITLTIPATMDAFPATAVPLQISAICRATQTAVLTVQVGEGQ